MLNNDYQVHKLMREVAALTKRLHLVEARMRLHDTRTSCTCEAQSRMKYIAKTDKGEHLYCYRCDLFIRG